jgi:hypothetical protein
MLAAGIVDADALPTSEKLTPAAPSTFAAAALLVRFCFEACLTSDMSLLRKFARHASASEQGLFYPTIPNNLVEFHRVVTQPGRLNSLEPMRALDQSR